MEKIQILPKKNINGSIVAPPSKSYAQRAIALAGLAQNNIVVKGIGENSDVQAAVQAIKDLGAQIMLEGGDLIVFREIDKENTEDIVLNCKESGLSTRLFSAFSLLFNQAFEVRGEGSVLNRTMTMVADGLAAYGKSVHTNDGKLPMLITGEAKNGKVEIDGSLSSQFISGLLLTAPFLPFDSELKIKNLKSRPYINMTIDVLRKFDLSFKLMGADTFFIEGNQEVYRPVEFEVEGDWSSVSFFVVAAAIGGKIFLTGLKKFSKQADVKIIEVVEKVGATVLWSKEDVEIVHNRLTPFDFDATDCPDLFPPLVVLASYIDGISKIKGVHRLGNKESDRAKALVEECRKVGVKIEIVDDEMWVFGGILKVEENTVFDSHNDHRIAMAMSLYSIGAEYPIFIESYQAVNKSFPSFYTVFEQI